MTWETTILAGISAPASANNISKLDAWNKCEGNATGLSGLPINNPFNTTLNYGGGQSINGAGVKAYPTLTVGLQATVNTLLSSYYTGIVTNLRQDGPTGQFANAVGNSPWGTSGSCIASVLGTTESGGTSETGGVSGMSVGPGNVQYSYAQLEGIWNQAGGNPQAAPMAAAIAMAESGGNSAAYDNDSNGSVDRGLWQINSVHGALSTFDVMGNARAAVSISNNGTNWSPWVTYQTGAYQRYLQSNVPPDLNAPINATNAASGAGQSSSTQATLEGCNSIETMIVPWLCGGNIEGINGIGSSESFVLKIIDSLIGGILNPMIQIVAGTMGMIGGGIMVIGGIFVIISHTETYQEAKGAATQSVGMAAFLAGPEAGVAAEGATASRSTVSRNVGGTRMTRTSQSQPKTDTASILRSQAAMYSEQSKNYRAYLKALPSGQG